jgi:serine/threonine protein kinase
VKRIASPTTEYEIQEILRKNGKFGSVYRGLNCQSKQPVIIKVLSGHQNPEVIHRFENEYRLRLDHPNLISATDYFIYDENHYLIRPYMEGTDAAAYIMKNRITRNEFIQIAIDVLSALAHLHTHGILHTDIKPSNIILSKTDNGVKAYLTDLGLARNMNAPITQRPFALLYSPPEQVLQYHYLMNASSDIYSLGITLYELLTHTQPFKHPNPEFTMHLQLTQSLEAHKNIDSDIFQLLLKATQKPRFAKPPNLYPKIEVEQKLKDAIALRHASADEMRDEVMCSLK